MSDEFAELDRRIERAIVRIPDRLSTTNGERIRADWADAFARVLGGAVVPVRMFAFLPFPTALLTDPLPIQVCGGLLVLDHPKNDHEFDSAFQLGVHRGRVQAHPCPRWWSLYDKRHPRLIVCPDPGEAVQLSDLLNRVGNTWHGPFEAPPTWSVVGSQSGPFRSLVRVEHPVADEWFERL